MRPMPRRPEIVQKNSYNCKIQIARQKGAGTNKQTMLKETNCRINKVCSYFENKSINDKRIKRKDPLLSMNIPQNENLTAFYLI